MPPTPTPPGPSATSGPAAADHAPIDPGTNPALIDTGTAHPARIYNYCLGGKDNYPVDREAAEALLAQQPEARDMALANRAFLGRAVRYAAAAGVRQFLDVGTGIPGPGGIEESARAVIPDADIVCVDNDPIVIAHARARVNRRGPGRTAVVTGDVREPEAILDHLDTRTTIDFNQPVAVLLLAVLHFVREREDPRGLVKRLMQAVAPGSYLVVSHGTADFDPNGTAALMDDFDGESFTFAPRSRAQVAALFEGLEPVEPGVVQVPWWRPDAEIQQNADRIWVYGGVGRKA